MFDGKMFTRIQFHLLVITTLKSAFKASHLHTYSVVIQIIALSVETIINNCMWDENFEIIKLIAISFNKEK